MMSYINHRERCFHPLCQCKIQKVGWKPSQTSLPSAGSRVAAAAVTSGRMPPPPQPPKQQQPSPNAAAVASPGPVGMAAATRLLEAIPRARTVRELRGVLQQAQTQGCLTTAHSLAAVMHLGTLVAVAPTPGAAEEARQLGSQLVRGLRVQLHSLPPALRAAAESAVSALGLSSDLEGAAAAAEEATQQAGGGPPPGDAASGRGAYPSRAGPGSGGGGGGSGAAGSTSASGGSARAGQIPAGAPAQQQSWKQQNQQQLQQQQRQPKQQRLPQQPQRQTQRQTAAEPGTSSPARVATSPTPAPAIPHTTSSSAPGLVPAPSIPAAAAQPTTPPPPPAPASPPAQALPARSSAASGSVEAPTSSEASTAELAFQEALLAGWGAWRDREQSGAAAAAALAGGDLQRRSAMEAALQLLPPAEMAIGDVAEVVHLLLALRLMPRHEWLCAARGRLHEEMTAVGARTLGDATAVLEDLRQVYEATEELMQMCWEADGRPAAGLQDAAGAALPGQEGQEGAAPPQEQLPPLQHQAAQGRGRERRVEATAALSAGAEGQQYPADAAVGGSSDSPQPGVSGDIGTASTTASAAAKGAAPAAAEGNGKSTAAAGADASLETELPNASPHITPELSGDAPGHPQSAPQQSSSSLEQLAPPQLLTTPEDDPWVAQPGEADVSGSEADNAAESSANDDGDGDEFDDDPAAAVERLETLLRQVRGAGGEEQPMMSELARGGASVTGGGDSVTAAAHAAVADLASLLVEALQQETAASRAALLAGGATAGGADSGGRRLALTAAQMGVMVAAARAALLPAALPPQLLVTAVRLLVASPVGGVVTCEQVAPVASACAAAGYVPPSYLLGQLAGLAFPTQLNSAEAAADSAAASASASASAAAPANGQREREQQQQQHKGGASAESVRALHECGTALGRLGCRLNNRQFGDWVDAVAHRPLALPAPQLAQLLATCTDRGFMVRPAASAAALIAAATRPPARLRRLSAAEAAAVARFAAHQGLQLGDSAAGGSGGAAALLQHLAPKLRELGSEELAALLPALRAAGALRSASGAADAAGSSSESAVWLGEHSAALLPHGEALAVDAVLPLLRCYDQLDYRPPALLLLGVSLALESQLASAPLLPLLQALHLLLCRLGFQPNEGLAAACQEQLVPRLMLAATAAPATPAAAQQQQHQHQQLAGLTMPQRLMVLDLLAAARVRPHPAQLAALLEVEMAGGEGLLAALTGDELVRLLWRCVAFRALPSWRFIGEWLEAFAGAMGGGAGTEGQGPVSSGALARVGWCLAQMGVQPEQEWQAAYQAALAPVLGQLDAEGLSLVAHSALLLRARPSDEWLEGLLRAALGRMDELMDGGSAARLLHFAAAEEVEVSKDWMQSFFLNTMNLVAGAPSAHGDPHTATAISSDQIALMLRALARLGFRPPEAWLAASLERLRTSAPALSPACFPVALMSAVRLCPELVSEVGPGSVVDELVRAAYRKRGEFSSLELQWLLDALACYPGYQLPPAAAANLVAALRRREGLEEGLEEAEGEGGGDVAVALGDAVSGSWLQWG